MAAAKATGKHGEVVLTAKRAVLVAAFLESAKSIAAGKSIGDQTNSMTGDGVAAQCHLRAQKGVHYRGMLFRASHSLASAHGSDQALWLPSHTPAFLHFVAGSSLFKLFRHAGEAPTSQLRLYMAATYKAGLGMPATYKERMRIKGVKRACNVQVKKICHDGL